MYVPRNTTTSSNSSGNSSIFFFSSLGCPVLRKVHERGGNGRLFPISLTSPLLGCLLKGNLCGITVCLMTFLTTVFMTFLMKDFYHRLKVVFLTTAFGDRFWRPSLMTVFTCGFFEEYRRQKSCKPWSNFPSVFFLSNILLLTLGTYVLRGTFIT